MLDMEVDLVSLGCTYGNWKEDPEARAAHELTSHELLRWMQEGDIDTENALVKRESMELVNLLQDVASGVKVVDAATKLDSFSWKHIEVLGLPPRWYLPASCVFWIGLWFLGLRQLRQSNVTAC